MRAQMAGAALWLVWAGLAGARAGDWWSYHGNYALAGRADLPAGRWRQAWSFRADAPVSVSDLIKKLNDASLPMSERKAAIHAWAELGTPEAIAALKEH